MRPSKNKAVEKHSPSLNACSLTDKKRVYLVQTGVLNMIRSNRFLAFDLYTYVHADGPRHSGFVSTFVCEEHKTHRNTVTRSALERNDG